MLIFFAIWFSFIALLCWLDSWSARRDDYQLVLFADATDREYLSQMPTDVSAEVGLGVRTILVDVSGVDADEVWPTTRLTEILE